MIRGIVGILLAGIAMFSLPPHVFAEEKADAEDNIALELINSCADKLGSLKSYYVQVSFSEELKGENQPATFQEGTERR